MRFAFLFTSVFLLAFVAIAQGEWLDFTGESKLFS